MNGYSDDGEDGEGIYLDEADVIEEITLDDEVLPDADDDSHSETDAENLDDSVLVFTRHSGELYAVACNPSEEALVATCGGDHKGFLWKIDQAEWYFELPEHKDSVSVVSFSSDGQLLASGSTDGFIKVWDISSGQMKCELEGADAEVEWLRWHPKGHLLLAGSKDGLVWMWNVDNKIPKPQIFSGHGGSVTCGDFTPDGKLICTGSDDASFIIWNPKTRESIHVVKGYPYHTEALTSLAMTDSKHISASTIAITGSEDGSVHIVNVVTGKVVGSLHAHTDTVNCIAISPCFPMAATGGSDQKLIIWDLRHFLPWCICEHEDTVTCLLLLGASEYVATGCSDGKVRVWDSRSGSCVRTLCGHSDEIQSLALSKNGDFLVSASYDGTARVFDVSDFTSK